MTSLFHQIMGNWQEAISKERDKKLRDAEEAVKSASQRIFIIWPVFALVLINMLIAVIGTSHQDLLIGKNISLSKIIENVPLVIFYIIAPILVFVIHLMNLTQLLILKSSIGFYRKTILSAEYSFDERKNSFNKIWFGLFVFAPDLGKHKYIKYAQEFLDIISLRISPPLLFIIIQIRFLPYHDVQITWLHRLLFVADLILVAFFIYMGRRYLRDERNIKNSELRKWVCRGGYVAGAAIAIVALFISFFAAQQREDERWNPFSLACGASANPLSPDSCASYKMRPWPVAKFFEGELNWTLGKRVTGLASRDLIIKELDAPKDVNSPNSKVGLSLKGRDLQGAIISNAVLQKADFSAVNLTDAEISQSDLRGANFFRGILNGINLTKNNMLGVNLLGAQLKGATIIDIDLPWSILIRSNFEAAILNNVNMQGARLYFANLSSSNLNRVKLQSAWLNGSVWAGAQLKNIGFEGADISLADMDGANMENCQLWRVQGKLKNDKAIECKNSSDNAFQFFQDYKKIYDESTNYEIVTADVRIFQEAIDVKTFNLELLNPDYDVKKTIKASPLQSNQSSIIKDITSTYTEKNTENEASFKFDDICDASEGPRFNKFKNYVRSLTPNKVVVANPGKMEIRDKKAFLFIKGTVSSKICVAALKAVEPESLWSLWFMRDFLDVFALQDMPMPGQNDSYPSRIDLIKQLKEIIEGQIAAKNNANALKLIDKGFTLIRRVRQYDYADLTMKGRVAQYLTQFAELSKQAGNKTLSLQTHEESIDVYRALVRDTPLADLQKGKKLLYISAILINVADLFDGAGRRQDALNLYEESLNILDKDPKLLAQDSQAQGLKFSTLVKKANLSVRSGNYKEAEHVSDNLITLGKQTKNNQMQIFGFAWRSFSRLFLRKFVEAEADNRTALTLSPDDDQNKIGLMYALMFQNKMDDLNASFGEKFIKEIRDKKFGEISVKDNMRDEIKQLRDGGLNHSYMEQIEKLL